MTIKCNDSKDTGHTQSPTQAQTPQSMSVTTKKVAVGATTGY